MGRLNFPSGMNEDASQLARYLSNEKRRRDSLYVHLVLDGILQSKQAMIFQWSEIKTSKNIL